MPEGGRGAPRCRRRETDHSQQGANGTKSESHEGARIKETGLRRGIFFHGDFPLLAAVETVADNSKTSPRPDAFFSDHSKSAAKNSHRQGPEVCPSRHARDFEAVTGLTM